MREILLMIAGIATLGFATFHVYLPKMMNWDQDLESLFVGNRKTVRALNIAIVYLMVAMGVLSIYLTLTGVSPLAGILIWGMAGFWLARTLIQAFVYGYDWKPSYGLTAMFVAMTSLYVVAALR